MSVIFLLIPLSILIAICFFTAFIWAVRSGQYEDTHTPALRLLMEEKRTKREVPGGKPAATAQSNLNEPGANNEQR